MKNRFTFSICCLKMLEKLKRNGSTAGQKSGEWEQSSERMWKKLAGARAEREVGEWGTQHAARATEIGLSDERKFCRSSSAHMLCQTVYSECSRFHPNQFTFGRVIAERVNIVNMRCKVNPILGWSLALSRTSSSAAAERPREPLSQLKSCQLLHNWTKNHTWLEGLPFHVV